MSGLGAEAERRPGLVAGDPGRAVRDVEESGGGGDPGDLGGSGGGEDPVEGPGTSGGHLGIEDLEAVEEDAGRDAGVAHVRDGELVGGREERDGDVGLHAVRHGAVERLLGHERPVHEDLHVVVHDGLGVGAALEGHDEPRRLGRRGVEALESEGLGLAHPGAERLPLPQVLDVEDVGREDAVRLEGGRAARRHCGRAVRGCGDDAHRDATGPALEGVDDLGREGGGRHGLVHVEDEPAAGAERGRAGQDEEGHEDAAGVSCQAQRREGPGGRACGEDRLEGDGVQALLRGAEEGVGVRVGTRAGDASAEPPASDLGGLGPGEVDAHGEAPGENERSTRGVVAQGQELEGEGLVLPLEALAGETRRNAREHRGRDGGEPRPARTVPSATTRPAGIRRRQARGRRRCARLAPGSTRCEPGGRRRRRAGRA